MWSLHLSMVTERKNVICVPSCWWKPEQSKQMKIPNLADAHVGILSGRSKHVFLSSTISSLPSTVRRSKYLWPTVPCLSVFSVELVQKYELCSDSDPSKMGTDLQ